jgi:asparagine synthase (glutamine-hydrolysing)
VGLADTIGDIRTERLRVSALEATWYMRNQLLRDTDWASMSHSVEVRVPLVDWTLWQQVVPLLLAGAELGKASLARAPRPPLPAAVERRAKTGFVIPVRQWLVDEFGDRYDERGLRGWARYVYEAA